MTDYFNMVRQAASLPPDKGTNDTGRGPIYSVGAGMPEWGEQCGAIKKRGCRSLVRAEAVYQPCGGFGYASRFWG